MAPGPTGLEPPLRNKRTTPKATFNNPRSSILPEGVPDINFLSSKSEFVSSPQGPQKLSSLKTFKINLLPPPPS